MKNVLNLYTLTFKDQELELKYQSQTIQKTLKPLYYAILISGTLMYSALLVITIITTGHILLINSCVICCFLIMMIIIYKNESHIQICMTFANCIVLMQQINVAQLTIPNQYSYMNGSMFAVLQTGLCFAIDFKYSFPTIILHFIFRFSVLTYFVQSFDFMLLLLGLMTLSFICSVLYICNRAQRLQFLMNLKDDIIIKQLETLINQPFSKIKYDKENLKIDVQMAKSIDQFMGHTDNFCYGCSIRKFLRCCKYNTKTLESGIANGIIPLNQSLLVTYNKQQLIIRICDYNIDRSLIIIQEKLQNYSNQENRIPEPFKRQLNKTFASCKTSKESQFYRFGVMSILQLNHMVIKTINISKIISRLRSLYEIQCKIVIKRNNLSDIKLNTYASLFKIYIIQILNIIAELRLQNNNLDKIEFLIFDICLIMKLKLRQTEPFLKYYDQNFFIKQIEEYLLLAPINCDLEFKFSKILPYR